MMELKAIEILKMFINGYAPEDEDIEEAIKELQDLETKIIEQDEAIAVDRLAELEKVILHYYLALGYKIGIGGWEFRVNITTEYKYKEVQVKFRKNNNSNFETIFRQKYKTTKDMFNETIEWFKTE